MLERGFRDLPASTGPVQKASLDEIGLVDVLEGALVFLNSGGERLHPTGPPTEFIDDRQEDVPIHLIETGGIDAQPRQGLLGDRSGNLSLRLHLRIVTDALDQPVDDARCAACAACDLRSALLVNGMPSKRAERMTMTSSSAGE